MRNRIIFDAALLVALFYAPWWFVVVVAFIGAFLWASFYEIIFLGLLADLLYGASILTYHGFLGVVTAVIIYFLASYARKIVR